MRIPFVGPSDAQATLEALHRSQAFIEFKLDGTILRANENFCRALGYDLDEIVGKHHSMFVEPGYAASQEYRDFWKRLSNGEFDQRQYKRIGKGGKEVWIEASYNPVLRNGKPYKVVKTATDITAAKLKASEDEGKIAAVSRAQAVIEFTPEGDIITANQNFLDTLGYQLTDVRSKHHSMFCDPDYARSEDYRSFWSRLRAGDFVSDEFMRIGRNGRRVFIQASYNPIFDLNGKVVKVVKFATDVSDRVRCVEELASGLQSLADGDLTKTLDKPFIPALEKLRGDFNTTCGKLHETMKALAENAQTIAAGSTEMQSAANDLSKRTEQQAASVEETAAALDQITQTVADSSRRADEAGLLVENARQSADASAKIVREAISAMSAIEGSSREISNIIGVIDDIAFQTNLLALNAGVEAARAGDAGKGFAVVAQEVRELAQRSAAAAKEIKTLINTSGDQVRSGVGLVGETGLALEKISGQVTEISVHVRAIVEGAREQAIGLREINTAVNTMDQGTQQNAAMVEEQTATGHSLAMEAEALFSLVRQFKLLSSSASANQNTRATSIKHTPREQLRHLHSAFNGNAARKRDAWEEF